MISAYQELLQTQGAAPGRAGPADCGVPDRHPQGRAVVRWNWESSPDLVIARSSLAGQGVIEHVRVLLALDDDVERSADPFEALGAGVRNHRDAQAGRAARHDAGMVQRKRPGAVADRAVHALDRDVRRPSPSRSCRRSASRPCPCPASRRGTACRSTCGPAWRRPRCDRAARVLRRTSRSRVACDPTVPSWDGGCSRGSSCAAESSSASPRPARRR